MAVAVVAGLASTAGAYGTAVALSATFSLAWAGTAFAIGAGLSMISQALQPNLRTGQDTGLSTSVANPIAERPIIYGRTRTGGTIVYFTTSGADNKYLHLVIAVAGHAIDGYEKVYFDDEVIWEDGSYVDDWVQNAQINFYDGTQTTADQDLINASNEWNSNCILNDTAYIHVRLEYDPEVYTNGIPNITTTIRGKKVLDPRTDVTAWSENPALCIYDYLKDPKYGLNDDTVNEAQVIASANVCDQLVTIDTGVDQTRYALSGFISTGDTIKANLEKMLSSMFGKLVCSGGELFVNAGYYTSPVLDIDESLLVGAVSLQTKTSRRNVYNAVKGTFLSEEENYIFADYPSIKSDTYSTEDGEPLYLDLPLPCTTNNVRAQRLAKLSLNKSRQQRSLSIPVNLAGLKVRAGDVIRFTSERLGISNAEYEVIDFEFEYSDQLIVNLVCVETGASLYDWTVADKLDFSVGSDITLYDGSAVAPTDLTATAVSNILSDGTDSTYIDVAWTNPSDIYFDYVVLKYGDQSIVTKDQSYRINNVDENTQYTITISAYNTFGRQSAGLSTNVTTVRDTTAPADITSITATGGLQSIDLSWTNPTDDDFDLVRIKVASTNVEPASHSYEVRADNFIDDVGAYSATRYYWLAPVDRTGNVGNYVSGGSATTGSIDYGDINNPPTIPEVATTAYLTLGDNDAPTDVEFNTAVGRDPIENDFAIVNKEFAFKYNGTTWDVVTEFIDGSLLVSESITALGEVTAGTFSLGNGAFAVNSSGQLNATGAIISGTLNAGTINAENISFTGSLIADGLSALPNVQAGNMTQSLRNEIENIIVNKFGSDASTGSFDEVTGTFNTNSDNSEICKITDFAHNGSDIDIDVTFSRLWESSASGTPSVVVNIQRSATGANSWTTIKTQTITGSSYYEPEVKKYLASISGNVTHTDNPATGNYDYRFFAGQILNLSTTTITVQLEANEQGEQIGTIDLANYSALAQDETITGNWTFSGSTSGISYDNLDNKPTIPDISGKADLAGATFTGGVEIAGASGAIASEPFTYSYATGTSLLIKGNESSIDIVGSDAGNHGSSLLLRNLNEGFGFINNPVDDRLELKSFTVNDNNFQVHATGSNVDGLNTLATFNKSGTVDFGGVISTTGGNSTEWNTGYDYSQVGHLPLSGGTLTGNIAIESTSPAFVLRDTNGTGASQSGYISLKDSDNSEKGWIGYGSTGDTDLTLRNSLGRVRANGTYFYADGYINAPYYQVNGTTVIDSSSNLTNIGDITLSGNIIMPNDNYVNRTFTMIENAATQYILLCANAGSNDVNATIRIDRTSGNYQAVILDVIVTSGSATMFGGTLRTLQVIQNSEDYRLVSVTYGGNNWIAIKYTGNAYPMTFPCTVTGRIKSTLPSELTVVSSGITNEASFGGNSESYQEVDNFVVSGDTTSSNGLFNGQLIVDGGTGVSSSGTLHLRQKGDTVNDGIAITSSNNTAHRIWKDSSGVLNFGVSSNGDQFGIDTSGNLKVNGTTVIDSSRNLTNVNTITQTGASGNSLYAISLTRGGTHIWSSQPYLRLGTSSSREDLNITDTATSINVMNGYQTEGAINIGRSDGTARYHTIYAYNDGTASNNYLKFNVHNGTVNSTTNALTLWGDGQAEISGLKISSGNINAKNATFDNGVSTTVSIACDNAGEAVLQLLGTSQGTGRLYVGQSSSYGGGIEYNGDNTPAYSGAGADYITLFRRSANSTFWTARNKHNSNNWEFRGSVIASGNVTAYSDITLKDNITNIDNALDKVNSIRGVTYDRIDQDNARHAGVIAQEVEEVLPEVVHTDENGIKSVAYGNMVGLLVEAIKELKAEIEELKK